MPENVIISEIDVTRKTTPPGSPIIAEASLGKFAQGMKTVGVAESGVLIRKTSIRRRLSQTEKSEAPFGQKLVEYKKIADKIMTEPPLTNALEGLRERWKMLMFMYEDTLDVIKMKKEKRAQSRRCTQRREIFATSIVYGVISLFMFIFILNISLVIAWLL